VQDRESEGTAPLILDLATRWEVNGQLLVPADSVLIKVPTINIKQDVGGPRSLGAPGG
jgi:hypothetical protein